MEKEPSPDVQEYLSAAVDPLGWVNRQPYAELKQWMKRLAFQRDSSPIISPPSTIPLSYLIQLLLRADAPVKTNLRSIIPELLSEWNAYDSRKVLLDLLDLCGNLSCNEAESIIARIVTDKLGDSPADVQCRSRALGALQSIGTERTLHLFLRYLSHPRHAALCYRGLYRLNPAYAATELPTLVRLYSALGAMERLQDVLDLLFNETLTPPEYITVLRPFAEQAEPESFTEALRLLAAIKVFDIPFFSTLSASQSHALFSQLLKRARTEDCGEIVSLIGDMGMTIEPPPGDMDYWQDDINLTDDDEGARGGSGQQAQTAAAASSPDDDFYYIVPQFHAEGLPRKWPLARRSELSDSKRWQLMRAAQPNIIVYINEASEYVS